MKPLVSLCAMYQCMDDCLVLLFPKSLSNVGGLEPWNFMTFHSVGNVITPTDELIFFRGVETTNQLYNPNLMYCNYFLSADAM